jgi:hypothetical protein
MTRRLFDARFWHTSQHVAFEREAEDKEKEAGNMPSVAQKDPVRVPAPVLPRLAPKKQQHQVVDYSSFFTKKGHDE